MKKVYKYFSIDFEQVEAHEDITEYIIYTSEPVACSNAKVKHTKFKNPNPHHEVLIHTKSGRTIKAHGDDAKNFMSDFKEWCES